MSGQLISVSDGGLVIRVAQGGQIQERAVPFDQIQSMRHKKDSHTGLKILAGVGIALGGLVLLGAIVGG